MKDRTLIVSSMAALALAANLASAQNAETGQAAGDRQEVVTFMAGQGAVAGQSAERLGAGGMGGVGTSTMVTQAGNARARFVSSSRSTGVFARAGGPDRTLVVPKSVPNAEEIAGQSPALGGYGGGAGGGFIYGGSGGWSMIVGQTGAAGAKARLILHARKSDAEAFQKGNLSLDDFRRKVSLLIYEPAGRPGSRPSGALNRRRGTEARQGA